MTTYFLVSTSGVHSIVQLKIARERAPIAYRLSGAYRFLVRKHVSVSYEYGVYETVVFVKCLLEHQSIPSSFAVAIYRTENQ